jgi:hemerythrin
MSDKNALENIPEEHRKVRRLLISVDDSMGDLDAFFKLQTERFDLSQVELNALTEKKAELIRTFNELWKGLKKHFDYEEENLSETLGKTLTRALKIEHADIRHMMESVKNTIAETSLQDGTRGELLTKKIALEEAIGKLTDRLEEHARDEAVLFKLVDMAIRKREKS